MKAKSPQAVQSRSVKPEPMVTFRLPKSKAERFYKVFKYIGYSLDFHVKTAAIRHFFERKLCDQVVIDIINGLVEDERDNKPAKYEQEWREEYKQSYQPDAELHDYIEIESILEEALEGGAAC